MKRFTMIHLAALAAALLALTPRPVPAGDVNLARAEAGRGTFDTSFGLDPAVLTTVGYTRGFGVGSRVALWNADLGVAVAETDLQDMRARIGLLAPLWNSGGWQVALRGRAIARSTSNVVYDGVAFGADLTGYAGWYRRGWFAAGLVGYDRTFVMHMEHSDWYRDNVYPDAVDGWYRARSGILRGGVAAGFTVGRVEVASRLELRRLDGGEPLDPPFVGELTLSVPF